MITATAADGLPIDQPLRNLTRAMIITSPANERLKQARRVRDGRERGLIFVEGERLVEECLQSSLQLVACFHLPEPNPRAQRIIAELARRNCPLYPTTEAALETVSDTVNTRRHKRTHLVNRCIRSLADYLR